jgi:hypothetical protein
MIACSSQTNETNKISLTAFRVAKVTGRADDWFFIHDLNAIRLKRAASCLIEPQLGDTVLIFDAGPENVSFITAVLVSNQVDKSKICLPGGATLETIDQQLTVNAASISINGQSSVSLNSALVDVNAVVATLKVTHWQSWSESIESQAVRATFAFKSLQTHINQSISRIRNSFRKVDELDETQAGRMRVSVEGHHHLNAEHVTTQARGFVRIDGKKIDLG